MMDSISAVYRLRYDFDNLLFLIVGMPIVHGNNFTNLEYCLNMFKRVKTLNMFDIVNIYPKYLNENDWDYYTGAADIMIDNYYHTQYSISGISHLIMSYGMPNTSSKANILCDLDNTRSLKFDIGNIEQMVYNLRLLIRSPELRTKLSTNCLKYAEETSWENIAKKHLALYQSFDGNI
jgi:glycosyltransferase involved in cell wall biosynthesis